MKSYKITFRPGWTDVLKKELDYWGISSKTYQIEDNILTTKNPEVVDTIIETFINQPYLYTIERI